jgi:hypothetical protein
MGAILERTNFELNDLTFVPMERIIVHWTGGVGKPNHIDKAHYHILIDEDGNYILGDKLIKQNKRPITGKYAAHTWKRNTGSIGVSAQYDALIVLLADLCDAYDIEVSRKTVLFHSEVEEFLKTKQRGKVDIDRLPWDTSLRKYNIGDAMREMVVSHMESDHELEMAESIDIRFVASSKALIGFEQNCDYYFKARDVSSCSGWSIPFASGEELTFSYNGVSENYNIILDNGSGYISLSDIKDFSEKSGREFQIIPQSP